MIPINDSKCEQCQQVIQVMRSNMIFMGRTNMKTSCACLEAGTSAPVTDTTEERWSRALRRHRAKVAEVMT